MTGLVLEGGGAKGAYHIGAVKALFECGYKFDMAAGTSIGAINGALIAQGDFDLAYEWWSNLEPGMLFDFTQKDEGEIIPYSGAVKKIIGNGGIDTSRIKELLNQVIDEEKIRKSDIGFGMVTISINDFKPLELYKEDIPIGEMADYLMAGANLPVFKMQPLDGKFYLDGSFYDNCPIRLITKKGFDNIIIVRTYPNRRIRNLKNTGAAALIIAPSEELGWMLDFDAATIRRSMDMGYCDAMCALSRVKGRRYYIKDAKDHVFLEALLRIPRDTVLSLGEHFKIRGMDEKRMMLEKLIPKAARVLSLPQSSSYTDVALAIMENTASKRGVERLNIYNVAEFASLIYNSKEYKEAPTIGAVAGDANIAAKISEILENEQFLSKLCDALIAELI